MDGRMMDSYTQVYKKLLNRLLEKTDLITEDILGFERFLIIDKYTWFKEFIKQNEILPIQIDWQLTSRCNLNCRWCVGANINKENETSEIPDSMNKEDIQRIATQIICAKKNGTKIETVQFSGFTGEPLLKWDCLMMAIKILKKGNLKIGIFTNGTLMTEKTWNVLCHTDSVHISIDGGPETWNAIKQPNYIKYTYFTIINNIKGLVEEKKRIESKTEINAGYTVTYDNFKDLETVIKDLIEVGANSICIKFDITGNEKDKIENEEAMISTINNYIKKYNSERFKVLMMHTYVPEKSRGRWKCSQGCYYRYFFATIGSDGKVYPCDYQTSKECPNFGDLRQNSLCDALYNKQERWDGIITTKSDVTNICPPFAEVINPYLKEVTTLVQEFGADMVIKVYEEMRNQILKK